MSIPNQKLKPTDGISKFKDRKITPMYNFRLERWEFAIASRTQDGIKIYLNAEGETFNALDIDPTKHDANMSLSPDDLTMLLKIAEETPAEAALMLKTEIPAEFKPQVQTALKTLSKPAYDRLKAEAIALNNQPKIKEEAIA